jgi:zinc transport system ATP-binding protein
MDRTTLKLIVNGEIVFQSDQGWLHPLFKLEAFLKDHPAEMSTAEVQDKVIGKAAAMLIARMGAGSAHGEVMSELGREVFERAGIPHSFGQLVARIDCQTEELLLEVNDLERAHQLLMERTGRSDTEDPDC